MMDWFWAVYVSMWMGSAVAVTMAIEVTKSPWCLLALLIPAMVRYNFKSKDNNDEDNKEEK